MKKVLIIFGTRPEAIKMAPLVKEFQKNNIYFETKVCVTAQHREMLDQVLKIFDIKPDFDLDIMKQKQDLYDITLHVLTGVKNVLEVFKPDIMLVHGDTTTTSISSLAAFYRKIKVGHIEAGLRTDNLYAPFPEEANRQITSVLSHYHFAPTQDNKNNLLKENKRKEKIVITGNTVIDAMFLVLEKIKNQPNLKNQILKEISHYYTFNKNRKIILVTGHRRESFGVGFVNICEAIKTLAINNPTIDILYPVHLNPNVQKPVKKILSNINNIYLIKPLQYEVFLYLMQCSFIIITDSGGIQEEAPSLGKPVIVTRDVTERTEALNAGTIKLVGTDKEKIVKETQKLIDNEVEYLKMSNIKNPYGDANASKRIVEFIKKDL